MTLKTLGPKKAAELDAELMSEAGGYTIDQLMELAGLSVSQAVWKVHPPSKGRNILVACGPGNNGGDGLVAARHLHHYGYAPTIYYPKPTNKPIFTNLQTQLHNLHIPFVEDPSTVLPQTSLIIDALFGFSFHPPVRQPFDKLIAIFETTHIPILSVDIPSSWDVESGPPKSTTSSSTTTATTIDPEKKGGGGGSSSSELGSKFSPQYLISLTAPKPSVRFFRGEGKRHFVGGRFLPEDVAKKYGLDVPEYQGIDQIVEVDVNVTVEKV